MACGHEVLLDDPVQILVSQLVYLACVILGNFQYFHVHLAYLYVVQVGVGQTLVFELVYLACVILGNCSYFLVHLACLYEVLVDEVGHVYLVGYHEVHYRDVTQHQDQYDYALR